MTGSLFPMVAAIAALVLHGFYAIGIRNRMYACLDVLSEDLRRNLGWPPLPGLMGEHEAHSKRIRAKTRLAHWRLPRSTRIPDPVYQAERAYRLHILVDNGLIVAMLVAFSQVGEQAWIIAVVGAIGFLALLALRKRFVDPWPDLDAPGSLPDDQPSS